MVRPKPTPGVKSVWAPADDEATRTSDLPFGGRVIESSRRAGDDTSYIGRVIEGKYRIDAKIGAGGMGAVYRAARLLIGDDVAIKILHPEHVSERFQREAQAAARLKHPNAVFIYDFGTTSDGLVYLVMELLVGQSLRSFIKQEGPLAATAAAEILNQVCGALEEAHRHQIVHRDLKPDNIIVNPTLNGLRVKVLDFGIAKLRDLAASEMTQTGAVMGTPHYMSPEQCLGEEIDGRSDIYSLGIVLYEMLAGMVPFNAPSSNAVVVQQVNQPPPALRNVNPAVSPAVEAVVLQALAKRREARPQSARALAVAFSNAVRADLPTPVVPSSPGADPVASTAPAPPPTVVMSPARRPDFVQSEPSGYRRQDGGNKSVPTALIVVGGLGLLAIGALIAVLLVGRPGTTANSAGSSPQPTIDPAHTSSAGPAESSTPRLNQPVPAPTTAANSGLTTNGSSKPPVSSGIPDRFARRYQGTINGQSFSMTLNRSGGELKGTASTTRSTDMLSGTIGNDGGFRLDGYENGAALTGIYTGQVHDNGTVTGYWTSARGPGRKISFYGREQ